MKILILGTSCLMFSIYSFAHSGRTDSSGCHNDRRNGTYHCHRSNEKMNSRTIASTAEGPNLKIKKEVKSKQ